MTVYVPAVEELTVRVELPDPPDGKLTLAGFAEPVRPEGDTEVVNAMLPVNPPRLLRVMIEPLDWPEKMVRLVELEDMEKSTTLTVTWTERVREPLVAVMVRV